jgi:hypothetical protein
MEYQQAIIYPSILRTKLTQNLRTDGWITISSSRTLPEPALNSLSHNPPTALERRHVPQDRADIEACWIGRVVTNLLVEPLRAA